MPQTKDEYNAYMREYMLTRYHSRRGLAIEKLGGRCVVCGATEDLEFDHIDPSTKSFTIASASSVNEQAFWNEVAKCQLLCPLHHKEKSSKETLVRRCGSEELPHGHWKYRKEGCRCDCCITGHKEANRIYKKRYLQKKKK